MGQTILVVDDHANVRLLVAEYLREHDYRVLSAGDGAEALAVARRERPDLILLDLMMPNLDGFAFMQRYRQQHSAPIILLTARLEEFDKVAGLELGADDYVDQAVQHEGTAGPRPRRAAPRRGRPRAGGRGLPGSRSGARP